MRKLNTREKFLLGLLATAGIVGWYAMRGGGIGFGESGGGPQALMPIEGEPPIVRLDLLDRDRVAFDPNGRNLFAYYTPPAPKVTRPQPKPPPAPPPAPPPKKRTNPKPQAPVEPQPPSPDFDYVGYLGPKDNKIAVFAVGEDLLVARVGEVVKDEFELQEFRYDSVIFGFTNPQFQGKTTELKLHTSKD